MLASGSTIVEGGGRETWQRRGYRASDVFLVQWHWAMNRGTGTHLLSHILSPLELAPLFTGGWRAEEREAGWDGAQDQLGINLRYVRVGEEGRGGGHFLPINDQKRKQPHPIILYAVSAAAAVVVSYSG